MNRKKLMAKRETLVGKMENIVETRADSMDEAALEEVKGFKRQIDAIDLQLGTSDASETRAVVAGSDAEKEEFRTFLRTGVETRASVGNSNATAADGKALNPNAFSNELFTEVTSDNGVLSLLRQMPVASDKLDFPTTDDSATDAAAQSPELATITTRKLTITNVEITLNQYAVQTVLSNQLRNDEAVNLDGVIVELAGAAIARKASKDALVVIDAGITIADSAVIGDIDYTDLVTLLGSVNGKYYENGSFLMSQASFIGILALLDTNKQPIVKMPVEQGMKPSLFGKPITIDDNADIGAQTIYFGDFNTVVLATHTNTSTLVDIYSLSSDLATKYISQARMGAGVLSAKAVAGLTPKIA